MVDEIPSSVLKEKFKKALANETVNKVLKAVAHPMNGMTISSVWVIAVAC